MVTGQRGLLISLVVGQAPVAHKVLDAAHGQAGGSSFHSERASAQAEATGSPQVLGLGAQHWRLWWLEGLKLQSTARG